MCRASLGKQPRCNDGRPRVLNNRNCRPWRTSRHGLLWECQPTEGALHASDCKQHGSRLHETEIDLFFRGNFPAKPLRDNRQHHVIRPGKLRLTCFCIKMKQERVEPSSSPSKTTNYCERRTCAHNVGYVSFM